MTQLLRDNLTLWTSDMQGEGEEKPAEGSSILIFKREKQNLPRSEQKNDC